LAGLDVVGVQGRQVGEEFLAALLDVLVGLGADVGRLLLELLDELVGVGRQVVRRPGDAGQKQGGGGRRQEQIRPHAFLPRGMVRTRRQAERCAAAWFGPVARWCWSKDARILWAGSA